MTILLTLMMGTEDKPYKISKAEDLETLAELVNKGTSPYADEGTCYSLENNIDLSSYADGEGWDPIGTESNPFKGYFDGNGNQITGLSINSSGNYIGLFGYVKNGTIQNVRVTQAKINGGNCVGGVAGSAYSSTIEHCLSSGSVAGEHGVGGVAGIVDCSTIEQCLSSGSVSGESYVGGVVGYVYSYPSGSNTLQNCVALNSSVQGLKSVGRVVGIDGGTFLCFGNYAFEDIEVTVDGSPKDLDKGSKFDGEDVSIVQIYDPGFWKDSANWSGDTSWDENIWSFEEYGFPILKNVPEDQSEAGREHLKGEISETVVTITGDLTYTGKKQTPPLEVTYKGKKLTQDKHYEVVFVEGDGINAAEVKVQLNGINHFKGTKSKLDDENDITYTILPKSLLSEDILVEVEGAPFIYDGKEQKPEVIVKYGDITLEKDKDYTAYYEDNLNAGTAKVVITGMGNYKDTKTTEFTIEKRPVIIKADDKSITTGKTLPAFTYTVEGEIPGERAFTGEPVLFSPAADPNIAGIYQIEVDLKNVSYTENYKAGNPSFINGVLTVGAGQYVVAFDAQGGTASFSSKQVTYGNAYGDLPKASRAGYAFKGWFTAPEGGDQVTASNKVQIAKDHTLYAQWRPVSNTSSGSSSSSKTSEISSVSEVFIQIGENSYKDLAEISLKKQNGRTIALVALNSGKVIEKLDEIKTGALITVQVKETADTVLVKLDGKLAKALAENQNTLEIQTEFSTYRLPLNQIPIDSIIEKFGGNIDLAEIKLSIEISRASEEQIKLAEEAAAKGNHEIVAVPVSFTVKCIYGDKEIEIKEFSSYIERTIDIPDRADARKITTAVVIEQDGLLRPVPTKIITRDGRYYAQVKSMSNSVYALIQNRVEFKDVASHWAKEEINDMGSRLIINGSDDNMFTPGRDISRAEFAVIIVKALGLKPESGKMLFTDIKEDAWCSSYIHTASKYKIISGYEDGRFGPDDKITREQAMVMIARAMEITGLKAELTSGERDKFLKEFKDADRLSSYAKEGAAKCLKAGVIAGKNDRLMAPKDNITRAETVVMIRKMLQLSSLI